MVRMTVSLRVVKTVEKMAVLKVEQMAVELAA